MNVSAKERRTFERGQGARSRAILLKRKSYKCPVCRFTLPVAYILGEDGSCFACARLCEIGRQIMASPVTPR